ncbi:MAG: TRAP transporter small permease [Defluviicoccus sp.]|nr:TRAP transporter small permease [Defluviicoccus sp.]
MAGDAPSEPERLEQSALDRFTRHLFFFGSLASFMAMVLLIALDTILRYFFNAPIFGAQEVVGLGLLIAFLVALPHSWHGNYHVRMDLLYQRYGRRAKLLVDGLAGIGALAFGGLLAYQGYFTISRYMASRKTTSLLEIPYWPFSVCVGVFATVFCLSVVVNLIRAFRTPGSGNPR